MRKLVVSMNITLDGYMASGNGSIDWHFQHWVPSMGEVLAKELSEADTILLGRVTYEVMSQSWPVRALDLTLSREELSYTNMMNSYLKVTVSGTLKETTWNNSIIICRNIRQEIINLKKKPGKNIMLYGSGNLVNLLVRYNLVDEFQLWLHPVIEGNGNPLFMALKNKKNLRLTKFKAFDSGVLLACYEMKGNNDASLPKKPMFQVPVTKKLNIS